MTTSPDYNNNNHHDTSDERSLPHDASLPLVGRSSSSTTNRAGVDLPRTPPSSSSSRHRIRPHVQERHPPPPQEFPPGRWNIAEEEEEEEEERTTRPETTTTTSPTEEPPGLRLLGWGWGRSYGNVGSDAVPIMYAAGLGVVVGTGTVLLLRITDWVSSGWLLLYDRLLVMVVIPNVVKTGMLLAIPILGAVVAGGILEWGFRHFLRSRSSDHAGMFGMVLLLLCGDSFPIESVIPTSDHNDDNDADNDVNDDHEDDDENREQVQGHSSRAGTVSSSLALLVASVVVAAGAFPLGPELGLWAWARIATTVVVVPGRLQPSSQLWMPVAVAAALGGSGLPLAAAVLLGPLLLLELSPQLRQLLLVTRDSVISVSAPTPLPFRSNDDPPSDPTSEEPLLPRHGREIVSPPYASSAVESPEWTHVTMMTLQVVASLSAFGWRQSVMERWWIWNPAAIVPQKHFVHWDEEYQFQAWHLGLAVVLGVALGGLCSTLVWIWHSDCCCWKNIGSCCGGGWCSHGNSRRGRRRLCTMVWVGLIQGMLLIACPRAAGSGLSLLREAFASTTTTTTTTTTIGNSSSFIVSAPSSGKADDDDDYGRLTMSTTSPQQWLVMALCRLVGLGTSMGLGLWGGPVIPMAAVGLCLGLAMASSQDDGNYDESALPGSDYYLSVSLTVPCCMAACIGSMFPAPLTIALALVLVLGCSVEQVILILVSSLVAGCMTGGLGCRRSMLDEHQPSRRHHHPPHSTGDDDQRNDSVHDDNVAASDEEILRSVRATIFGSV